MSETQLENVMGRDIKRLEKKVKSLQEKLDKAMPFVEHMARSGCCHCQKNALDVESNYHASSCMVGKAQKTLTELKGKK